MTDWASTSPTGDVVRASLAAAFAVHHAREARRLLEEMGVLKVPSVLDVTRADVHHLGRRAMHELSPWWLEGFSLEQALKMAQPQAARAAVRILREGGHQLDDLAVRE